MSSGSVSRPPGSVLAVIERSSEAAELLKGLEPGLQTLDLFTELARLTVISTVELVPLRFNQDTEKTEVLLLQRPPSCSWWPRQWHVPGTMIRPTDPIPHDNDIDFDDPNFDPSRSYDSPLKRLVNKELEDRIDIVHGPRFLEARYRAGTRGNESTVMLWAGISALGEGNPSAQLFDVDEISSGEANIDLIVGHAGLVRRAARAYETFRAMSV